MIVSGNGIALRAVRLIIVLLAPLGGVDVWCASVSVFYDRGNAQIGFAVDEIGDALCTRGCELRGFEPAEIEYAGGALRIVLSTVSDANVARLLRAAGGSAPQELEPEGYSIRLTEVESARTCWVLGADSAGAMYGGLEVAEIIRADGLEGLEETDVNPHMTMRGTKFNCPLDARTPSYSDVCDAGQNNIAEMWNFDFWKEYIDALALYRYNFISLWSLHPFPSLVKVPGYEEIALDDVKRSTADWQEYYDLEGTGFDAAEILDNLETLKRMSIEEKVAFWRKVMRYGKERNVDFYIVTWNIFVNGTYGKYGITDRIDNATTRDYFRKSVRQMFLTYPDLAGIGLTTGENMRGASFEQKEDWAFETYARGVLDAAAEQPNRRFMLIHRQHQAGARDIARKFKPVIDHPNIEFVFSFKYAQAHVYSSTRQVFHQRFVGDIGDVKTMWTLRNDDNYYFRWGGADFVREFIANIPHEVSKGFYFGSDQYIWGREFLSSEPESPRQLEVVKHWYHWMLWGRLGYDPLLTNERLIKVLGARYPQAKGEDLFSAWQHASMIYPLTTGFHWGALDFQWYIEACKSRPGPAQTATGFHDVNRFITLGPHGGTEYISIPAYVKSVVDGRAIDGTAPPIVARRIEAHADKAIEIVGRLDHGGDKELRLTLEDIRTMAWLGKYYAHKIRGATEMALFRATDGSPHREAAVRELNHAAACWRMYASLALGRYDNPLWTNRVGYCDWRGLTDEVLQDVVIAGGSPQPSSMAPTAGGIVLEAEEAEFANARKASTCQGYTGEGYVEVGDASAGAWVEWKFEAPREGTYVLELRYVKESGRDDAGLTVNGMDRGRIVMWGTGGGQTWGWDRKAVVLKKGYNRIRLSPGGACAVDHLNILQ